MKESGMAKKEFFGVFPYLISPIDSEGQVKEEVLRVLVEHLIQSQVHGLTPLGSTGEFAYLTWPQRRRIVEVVIKATSGKVPVVAGVAHTAIHEAVRQAREMEAMGVRWNFGYYGVLFPGSFKGSHLLFS
jgi:dihydrodipicolinate synthase/N-acetylneuraminate lyase